MNHYSNNTAAFTSLTTTYCVTHSHFVGESYSIPLTQPLFNSAELVKNSPPAVEPITVELAEPRNLAANIAAIVSATEGNTALMKSLR